MNAKTQLQRVETGLKELEEKRQAIIERVNGLVRIREALVRGLASGDKASSRKKIEEVDLKLESAKLDEEGLTLLVEEGQREVSEAEANLKAIQEEEKQAFEAYCHEREVEECTEQVAEISDRIKKWIGNYISQCCELTEIHLVVTRAALAGIDTGEAQAGLFRLASSIHGAVRAGNFKHLVSSGIAGEVTCWPLTVESSAVTREIETARREARRALWAEEFRKEKGEN